MTCFAGGRTGLLALFDPIAVASPAMIHDLFFRQSALALQIFNGAQLLGKYIMTDVAVTQRGLMLSMRETNHASLASVKGYLLRAFFFNSSNDDAAIKKHEYNTHHNNF